MKRSKYCGLFTEEDMHKKITAYGWVQTKRDLGGVIFIDLKDREGILQVVFDGNNLSNEDFEKAERLRNQTVITVTGIIRLRDEETYNPLLKTGTIELKAEKLEILSKAATLPFSLENETLVREDLRLKYRYLDLRRESMLNNLRYRHKLQKIIEDFFDKEGFISVETPMLTKSTPEGARDYLVPSRVHPGSFYALPQSPQIFKQLLMVGGIDKYYQIARCFRDEDLRADRQPEFTQVDMELSFVDQEDILVLLEELFKRIFKLAKGIDIQEPFPRLTWQESMDIYGSDKPDLRFDLPIVDLTEIASSCSLGVFRKAVDEGGVVRAINVKGGASFTRSEIDELTNKALHYGAKGMAWIAIREDGSLYSILTKYFKEEEMNSLLDKVKAEPGDFILFSADKLSTVRRTLGGLRLDIANSLGLISKENFKFVLVTDFPEFEYSDEEKRYIATHHPFTMPYPEDVEYLFTDPARVRAQAYDVVLNGVELGSGSIRIHDTELQKKMFKALGFSSEEIQERFGFMVEAFKYGTPPHGGFAFGLDRLVMLMTGADSLREVIAFPKVKDASCPLTNAPSTVDKEQLEVLKLMEAGFKPEGGSKRRSKRIMDEINVDNIAHLARLSIRNEEKEALKKDMESIIDFARELQDIDTEDIPITAHVVPLKNVFRKDEVLPSTSRDKLLQNAPTKDEEYIYVPRVVE